MFSGFVLNAFCAFEMSIKKKQCSIGKSVKENALLAVICEQYSIRMPKLRDKWHQLVHHLYEYIQGNSVTQSNASTFSRSFKWTIIMHWLLTCNDEHENAKSKSNALVGTAHSNSTEERMKKKPKVIHFLTSHKRIKTLFIIFKCIFEKNCAHTFFCCIDTKT